MKAIIFDLDGTLLNTLDDLGSSMNHVLTKHNFPIYPIDQYRFFVGNGMYNLVKNAVNPYTNDPELTSLMFEEMKAEYQNNWHIKTKPYDCIESLLTKLSNAGFILNIFSNKPEYFTQETVRYFFPQIRFSYIIGASEKFPNKPDPMGVRFIINQTKLTEEDFIMIGDSCVDIYTAQNANIYPAGVLWGFREEEELIKAGAKHIFSHPSDIFNFLNY